jgi:hypothetical protein
VEALFAAARLRRAGREFWTRPTPGVTDAGRRASACRFTIQNPCQNLCNVTGCSGDRGPAQPAGSYRRTFSRRHAPPQLAPVRWACNVPNTDGKGGAASHSTFNNRQG